MAVSLRKAPSGVSPGAKSSDGNEYLRSPSENVQRLGDVDRAAQTFRRVAKIWAMCRGECKKASALAESRLPALSSVIFSRMHMRTSATHLRDGS